MITVTRINGFIHFKNWRPTKLNNMAMTSLNRLLNSRHLQLLNEDQLPPDMREVAILKGYRPPKCTIKQCLTSIIVATNETLNIWTHFLPTLYFCWKLAAICDTLDVTSHPYTWSFVSYMITVCTYPLISAMAHTFYSISNMARHIWFFFDYGALSFYSFGAGLLYRAYVFPEDLLNTWLSDHFLNVCFASAILCITLACWSRFIKNLFWIKVFRLGAFILPWIWDSIPLVYRILYDSNPDSPSTMHYVWQFLFSFMIAFFYASHLPERLAPGKFDIIGHSHQLLHIAGILATNEQMNGALYDMTVRRNKLENNDQMISAEWPVYKFLFLFLSIIFIICVFSIYAWREEKNAKKKRQ
ncbi:membrane progestin receptor gamma-like isoform X1 [Centruroides sculpturatus]|uniref:membrane progestin receptor gamma-like isoform X1 n=2 Tax=Centruroides sculpturatus TaxID=218467 RepID=UPI000C6ED3EF|nr:membrane progestin receptor gamma-like isoform X1 [Centruroides sculpturatus]